LILDGGLDTWILKPL